MSHGLDFANAKSGDGKQSREGTWGHWIASLRSNDGGDFVFCNDDVRKIAASSAAMTDVIYAAMTGEICVTMTDGLGWQ